LTKLALGKSKLFSDLPNIVDFAKSPFDKQVLNILIAPQYWGRPFALPPGVPQDRVDAIRTAFTEMTKDAGFLADAKKLDLDLAPITGQRMDEVLSQIYETPPAVIETTRQAIAGN
jgi:hypothetical protein